MSGRPVAARIYNRCDPYGQGMMGYSEQSGQAAQPAKRYDQGRSGPLFRRRSLPAEPALPLLVGPYGPKEIDLAKFGPIDVGKVELAVGALPEQEA